MAFAGAFATALDEALAIDPARRVQVKFSDGLPLRGLILMLQSAPEDAEVVSFFDGWDSFLQARNGTGGVVVRSNSFPKVPEGYDPPCVCGTFTRNRSGVLTGIAVDWPEDEET